jgi:hypothetical protein
MGEGFGCVSFRGGDECWVNLFISELCLVLAVWDLGLIILVLWRGCVRESEKLVGS